MKHLSLRQRNTLYDIWLWLNKIHYLDTKTIYFIRRILDNGFYVEADSDKLNFMHDAYKVSLK
jgi:hypothetical protein